MRGNVGAVIASGGHQTLTLASLNIPYDEIHFGQPADCTSTRRLRVQRLARRRTGWRLRNFNAR